MGTVGEVVGQAEGKPNNQEILGDDQDILSRQQWLVEAGGPMAAFLSRNGSTRSVKMKHNQG